MVGAFREATLTRELTLALRTDFTRATFGSTGSAMISVTLGVHTLTAALGLPSQASHRAFPFQTDLALRTGVTASSTMSTVRL